MDYSSLVSAINLGPLIVAFLGLGALIVGVVVAQKGVKGVLDLFDGVDPTAKKSRQLRDREITKIVRSENAWRAKNTDRMRKKHFG